ncbi:MAG: hypothetical protein ACRDYW_01655 [Acidimicrobiales bacterium]
MTDAPDPGADVVIETALRLLPVPDHGPAFWAELDARFAAEPAPHVVEPALATGPPADHPHRFGDRLVELVPDTALALLPPALRRRSNVVLSAVAVAAAIMVVVAGGLLVRDRVGGGAGTDEAASRAGRTEDDAAGTTVDATPTSTRTGGDPDAEVPREAVLEWLAHLGAGDTGAAWASMGPASQAHFGSESAFAAEGSALAEGYGAWSAAEPDDVVVTALASSADGSLLIVTLVGTVEQEGSRSRRAEAIPVRVVDGVAHLEPFAFAGELEVVVPGTPPAEGSLPMVSTDDELVVVVPRGVEAPTIRIDDGQTLVCGEAEGTDLTELEGSPGQRCSYRPHDGLKAGTRVLTVGFLSADGTGVSAEAVLFTAA